MHASEPGGVSAVEGYDCVGILEKLLPPQVRHQLGTQNT